MVKLAAGRHTDYAETDGGTMGIPYPAAIAVCVPEAKERLLVAENLSDAVALMDAATGEMERTVRSCARVSMCRRPIRLRWR